MDRMNAPASNHIQVPDRPAMRLLDGEKILWCGKPASGLLLTPRDAFDIPFNVTWIGMVVFWGASAMRSDAQAPFILVGIPFGLIGLHFLIGRYAIDIFQRRCTTYVLTDRRALIERAGPWPKFQSVNLDRVVETSLEKHRNDRGSIYLGPRRLLTGRTDDSSTWFSGSDPTPQFTAIEDAERIFRLVQDSSKPRI